MPQSRTRLTAADSELAAEFARIRAASGVHLEFDPAALAQAHAARWGIVEHTEPRDERDIEFVTIDPPGSLDLDQAVHIARRGSGYRVRYAIADVGAFVRPGGALDAEVNRRGQTIYCPDRRVNLHPPILSQDRASLLAGQERRAVVWTMDLDDATELVDVHVARSLVRSRRQLTYEQAQREVTSNPLLAALQEVGAGRKALERARGGVSLERPEQVVERVGDAYRLRYRAHLPMEEHNAQISLLTGMTAATLMVDAGIGILRTMPPARAADLDRLRHRALGLGISWPPAASYAQVLSSLDKSAPRAMAFSVAATRLFRGAAWQVFAGAAPAASTHAALAARYAHVTAPLRRLVDRYGLEIAVAHCAGRAIPQWVSDGLSGLGERMGAAAQVGQVVDRACTNAVEAAVLADQVGQRFAAVGLDERSIQLEDIAVEASCSGTIAVGQRMEAILEQASVAGGIVKFRAA